MEGSKFCDILFSNYGGGSRTIGNMDLIHHIVANFDPSRFDLTKLNDIFVSFQTSHKISLAYNAEHVAKMELDVKYKKPVHFVFDSLTWTGTIVRHKWQNNQDGEEWYTLSIKLPNDGYVYNNKYAFQPPKQRASSSLPPASLDRRYYNNLKDLIVFTMGIFGDKQISTKVFYFVDDGRMNYKVRCEELKMWLQITFEYGTPKEDVTTDAGWYDREELKKILAEPVAK